MAIIAVEDELSGSDLPPLICLSGHLSGPLFGLLGYLLDAFPASVRVSFSACVRVSVRESVRVFAKHLSGYLLECLLCHGDLSLCILSVGQISREFFLDLRETPPYSVISFNLDQSPF